MEDEAGSRREETAQLPVKSRGEVAHLPGCMVDLFTSLWHRRIQVRSFGTEKSACPRRSSSVMNEERREMQRSYDGQGKKAAVVMANGKGKGE